jgi:AraC family transcriptional regulator, transcriptional activator of the genes for pyochelin and ferripyochelin receptors
MAPRFLTAEDKAKIYTAKTYILNHVHEQLTIKMISTHAGLSTFQLRDGFFLEFQMSPGKFIHQTRMELALFLLTHSEKNIKQIAGLTGFSNSANFSKAFKKFFNFTPGDVRRRI